MDSRQFKIKIKIRKGQWMQRINKCRKRRIYLINQRPLQDKLEIKLMKITN